LFPHMTRQMPTADSRWVCRLLASCDQALTLVSCFLRLCRRVFFSRNGLNSRAPSVNTFPLVFAENYFSRIFLSGPFHHSLPLDHQQTRHKLPPQGTVLFIGFSFFLDSFVTAVFVVLLSSFIRSSYSTPSFFSVSRACFFGV